MLISRWMMTRKKEEKKKKLPVLMKAAVGTERSICQAAGELSE